MKKLYLILAETPELRKEAVETHLRNEAVWYVPNREEARRVFNINNTEFKGVLYKEYWRMPDFFGVLAELYFAYVNHGLSVEQFSKAIDDSYKGTPTKLTIKTKDGFKYMYVGMHKNQAGKITHDGVYVDISV